MASRPENFDLLVESVGDGRFRSRVAASPVGAGAGATFGMPFDATELENLLLKLDPGRSRMRRASADPRPKASVKLGGRLFEAVFGEDVLLAWTRSQDATRDAGEGLRLRLQLTDVPEIAGLPWELLYDRRTNSYPAQSERTPLVRYLEVPQPPRPLTVHGPLRVLVVLASPTDLPELDVEGEWLRMQDMLASRVASRAVQLDRLPAPTTTELAAWLRSREVHVLHVVGHGDYDENQQEGVLYFGDQYGRSVAVTPGVLGPYLHDHARCGWCSSTPASPVAWAPPIRSAAWPSVSSSWTAPRSSPCSSPSPTAPRPRSPASSTRRSRTVCRSTRPSPALARDCWPGMRVSGPRRCSTSTRRTARCSRG
ncbi:MAG: CHAT domain-containing protein [Lapillicoccus sp.]